MVEASLENDPNSRIGGAIMAVMFDDVQSLFTAR